MRKDEREIVRWILRIVGNLIGVFVSVSVYNSTLDNNIAKGVSPNQASTSALIFAIVVLAAWVGVLEVAVRLGVPEPRRGGSGRWKYR